MQGGDLDAALGRQPPRLRRRGGEAHDLAAGLAVAARALLDVGEDVGLLDAAAGRLMRAMSTPCCSAIFLATGEAFTCEADADRFVAVRLAG